MRKLSIDRIDGVYAVCEDENRKMFAIRLNEMPPNARAGDIITIDDEGVITIDNKETEEIKKKVRKEEDELWS